MKKIIICNFYHRLYIEWNKKRVSINILCIYIYRLRLTFYNVINHTVVNQHYEMALQPRTYLYISNKIFLNILNTFIIYFDT